MIMTEFFKESESQEPEYADRFLIKVDGKWGYINRNGAVVIPPQFEYAEDFHNGLAIVPP